MRLETPLVSVIVPTYNRPDTLAEALQSIAAQTYNNVETIVVNDGGVDARPVISGLSAQCSIHYLHHSIRKGPAASRNTGLKTARGKYIAYLDDDDLYYPGHIKTLLDCLESSGQSVAYTDAFRAHQETSKSLIRNCVAVRTHCSRKTTLLYALSSLLPRSVRLALNYAARSLFPDSNLEFLALNRSSIDVFSRANGKYIVARRDVPYSMDFDSDLMLIQNYIPIPCLMHEKSCLDEVGLFDESLKTHEDWDLWIRLSRAYEFVHIKRRTCEYAWRRDGSTTTSDIAKDFDRTAELIYKKFSHLTGTKAHVVEAQRARLQNRGRRRA